MEQNNTLLGSNLTGHLCGALTLTERSAYVGSSYSGGSHPQHGASKAAQKVAQWRALEPFDHRDNFKRRLQLDGLTEEDLLRILALSPDTYGRCFTSHPNWIRELEALYSADVSEDDFGSQQGPAGQCRLALVAYPLIQEARRRILASLELLSMKDGPIEPSSLDRLLLPHLLGALKTLLVGVMALELNVARIRGLLKGESPEERFRYFCEALRNPEMRRSLLREYPVLFRALHTRVQNWVTHTLEVLSRLQQDWKLISETLSPGADPGALTNVDMVQGDEHRGGRSVAILEFSSGLKIVYKPRSMAVDAHFHEFLEWLQQVGFGLSLYIPKIIDRGPYGWSEFIEYRPCFHRKEVERYYQRLGGYLAVLYALRATDIHFDNIIAHGEFPVPVDLETLFHPDVEDPDDPALRIAQSSVMRVLLLPTVLGSETSEPFDVSALAAKARQYYPAGTVGICEAEGTDEMRLVYDKPVPLGIARSRPRLFDKDAPVQDFLLEFEKGFGQVYRLLELHRQELLASGGLLDRFADDEVRFIARPTRIYDILLKKSYHPDHLRDAIDREQLFDALWRHAPDLPLYTRLIRAEREDLHKGDIPVFSSRPNARDLWTSHGERIPGVFEQSALEQVRGGLARFGDEDLIRQTDFIRVAIISANERVHIAKQLPKPQARSSWEALDLARAIGDCLCQRVFESDLYASWIGLNLIGPREAAWSLEPLASDFYGGLAGVAFFLAYLGALTKNSRYSELARKSLNLIRRRLERRRQTGLRMDSLGAFSGGGGTIYALAHLGVLWQDDALIDEANALAFDLEPLVENDHMLDVIGGSAGFIVVLQVLYCISPNDRLLEIAIRCGKRLLRKQEPQTKGGAWRTKIESSAPLTGFSHGAAGIAWALLKLAVWSGDKSYRAGAESALTYERSTFVAEQLNWPDYRTGLGNAGFNVAWCHGASGIGLARLDNLAFMDDDETRKEISIALTKTVESTFRSDFSLCHGDFGKLDVLLSSADRVDHCWWNDRGERLFQQTLADIVERGPKCMVQSSFDSFGLMTGLAGIGYGLLRLAYPEQVPSVLTLAGPRNV